MSDTFTENDISWQPTTIIRSDDLVTKINELREQPGGYVYLYGSPTLVRSMMAADLVDELLSPSS
ncbi:MAG TPA: dihydrofolate reductase family protein [Acidimicrobiia bacterium]